MKITFKGKEPYCSSIMKCGEFATVAASGAIVYRGCDTIINLTNGDSYSIYAKFHVKLLKEGILTIELP